LIKYAYYNCLGRDKYDTMAEVEHSLTDP
jgi:hypothetical protein